MTGFRKSFHGVITWPSRHPLTSILIACAFSALAIWVVSSIRVKRILYYQGDQLSEHDLYGVWKIEDKSAKFLKEKYKKQKSFSNDEYIETNLWICLLPGNWCAHNCYVDYGNSDWFSRTQSRMVRQKLLFAKPVGADERDCAVKSLIDSSRELPDGEKIAQTLTKWQSGEYCKFDFFQRWIVRTNNTAEISYGGEVDYSEAAKQWIKYTVRLEGLEAGNDTVDRYLDPAFIFIGKDEKGLFLWMPVPWTYDGYILPFRLEGQNVVFRKADAE